MLIVVIIFISNITFAKDIIQVIAYKKQKQPAISINEHSPNEILFKKEYIESKPVAPNAFSVVESSAVEYQANVQDSGGHTGISINQLPFYYTGTFVDGILIPESSLDVSQFFGSHAVESVKVRRGSSVAGVLPGALAGAVEITTQEANAKGTKLSTLYGGYGTYKLSSLVSRKINNNSGVLFALTTNGQNAIDYNGNNIAQSPNTKNVYATVSHFVEEKGLKVKTRLDFSRNHRAGGSTIEDKQNTLGNPFNFAQIGGTSASTWLLPDGSTQTWNSGSVGLLEIINNNRASGLSSFESPNYIGGGMVSLLQRDNFYSGNTYKANEINMFGTLARKITLANYTFKLGGDILSQTLSSTIINNTGIINNPDGYTYNMASFFGQANYNVNNWDFDLSSRFGIHNVFGAIGTGRMKAGYHHTENVLSVISFGNGHYMPGSSFEQNHELVGGQIHSFAREVKKATQSINLAYNAVFTYNKWQGTAGYSYNKLENISTLNMEYENYGSGSEEINATFKLLNGYYQNHGINFDAIYFLNNTFTLSVGGERYWHDFSNLQQGFTMLSRPDYKIFTRIIASVEKNRFIFGATLFGRQNLQQFYGTTYSLQGQESVKNSPEFMIYNFDGSHQFNKKIQILYGVNNIGGFMQVKNSPQIVVVNHGSEYELHNKNAWGPVVGRRFYIGFNLNT